MSFTGTHDQAMALLKSHYGSEYNARASQYADERLAVGCAFFFAAVFHYVVSYSIHFAGKGDKKEFIHVERIFYLYGLASVLSYNLLQSGVFQAVFSFFTLITFIMIHLPTICPEKFQSLKGWFWIIFYFFMLVWFFGIIVDFYDAYKDLVP